MSVSRIIIGLGNPGDQYKKTRHNAGFIAFDYLTEKLGLSWEANKKFKAEVAKHTLADGSLALFVKPQTFMNLSGETANAILSFYKLSPRTLGLIKVKDADLSDILTVVHDDLDIELGKIKVSADSRSAGHNGVQSVIDHLKTKNFTRIRIGIKTEDLKNIPGKNFVLQRFKDEELKILDQTLKNDKNLQNIL